MADREIDFDAIWSTWVVPLSGRTISGMNGLTNDIVKVDSGGVTRISRNGLPSRIPIDPFQWAVRRIGAAGSVSRQEINDEFPHRYSSGVQLILEQVPLFEVSGRPARIRLRPGGESQVSRG